jgi:hypothetical protein
MITQSKQNWSIGETVKVGFLKLRVVDACAVKDGLPDIYLLESLDATKQYRFIPHHGITKLEADENWRRAW